MFERAMEEDIFQGIFNRQCDYSNAVLILCLDVKLVSHDLDLL
jgi:hypothetical protein